MEAYTRDVGGYQCLYADTFMSRDEFRAMFDHTLYDAARTKYGAVGAFPEVFDKVLYYVIVYYIIPLQACVERDYKI
jgi:Delta24-sterol reductase